MYLHVPASHRSKLESKSFKAIFVGYDENTKGFCCFSPERRKILISRDVQFDESEFGISVVPGPNPSTIQFGDLSTFDPPPPSSPPISEPPADSYVDTPPFDFPILPGPSSGPPSTEPIEPLLVSTEPIPELRRSGRLCSHNSRLLGFHAQPPSLEFSACTVKTTDPTISDSITLPQALSHPGWAAAMEEECSKAIRR